MVRRSVNAVRPTKARATLVLFAPISAKITYNGKRRVRKFGQLPKSDGCTKRNNGVARHLHALALIASVPRNIRGRTVCVSATLPACACCVSCSCFTSAHSWTRAFDFCVAHGLLGEMHLPLCEFIYQCVQTRKRVALLHLVHERWKLLELSKRLSAEYLSRENDATIR